MVVFHSKLSYQFPMKISLFHGELSHSKLHMSWGFSPEAALLQDTQFQALKLHDMPQELLADTHGRLVDLGKTFVRHILGRVLP